MSTLRRRPLPVGSEEVRRFKAGCVIASWIRLYVCQAEVACLERCAKRVLSKRLLSKRRDLFCGHPVFGQYNEGHPHVHVVLRQCGVDDLVGVNHRSDPCVVPDLLEDAVIPAASLA